MKKTALLFILALALAPLAGCGRRAKETAELEKNTVIRTLSQEEIDEMSELLADYLNETGVEYEGVDVRYGDDPFTYEIHVAVSREQAEALQADLQEGTQMLSDEFDGELTSLALICRDGIAEKGILADVTGVVEAEGFEGAFRSFDTEKVW